MKKTKLPTFNAYAEKRLGKKKVKELKAKAIELTAGSDNVFEDLGFDKEKAAELKLRSELMNLLTKYIKKKGYALEEAAVKLGVVSSMVSNVRHGKVDRLSVPKLLAMASRAGFPIYKKIGKLIKEL